MLTEQLIQEQPPLLRPTGVHRAGDVVYLIGVCDSKSKIGVALIQHPAAAYLVLNVQHVQQPVHASSRHSVVLASQGYDCGPAAENDITVPGLGQQGRDIVPICLVFRFQLNAALFSACSACMTLSHSSGLFSTLFVAYAPYLRMVGSTSSNTQRSKRSAVGSLLR